MTCDERGRGDGVADARVKAGAARDKAHKINEA